MKSLNLAVCALLTGFALSAMDNPTHKMLVIRTDNTPAYAGNRLNQMAQLLGFEPTVKQIYEVDETTLQDHTAIALALDPYLFKALIDGRKSAQDAHPFFEATERLATQLAVLSHKKIIFSLPSAALTKRNPQEADPDSEALVETLLRESNSAMPAAAAPQLKAYLRLAREPDARKHSYATALMLAKKREPNEGYQEAQDILKDTSGDALALPAPMPTEGSASALTGLWPFGISWRSEQNNNSILLTRDSYLTFGDIDENFHLNPIDPSIKHELFCALFRTLQQFLVNRDAPAARLKLRVALSAGTAHEQFLKRWHRTYAPTHAWLKEKQVSCAWMDVRSFFGKAPESVDYVLNSGIKILWLDLIPETLLTHNARNAAGKEEFLKQVEWFTRILKERAQVLNRPIPLLFMGTDVTLNYRVVPNHATPAVETPTVDLYGKVLSRVPSPLDVKGFWQTQVIDLINTFVDLWESKEGGIGNGLPLAGIFFDFEQYQAPEQASNYTDLMDFSDLAWQTFLAAYPQPNMPELTTAAKRVEYLIDTHQMQTYFDALTAQAKEIGTLIRNTIKQRLPHGMIAAYNANIASSWWYRGLMASLSRPEEPLMYATFNTDFFSHVSWLESQDVYLHHLQVLLLSKLREKDDFKQIGTILKNHDGIWFNRFSRLIQDMPENKTHADHIESSPLPKDEVAQRIYEQLRAHDAEN